MKRTRKRAGTDYIICSLGKARTKLRLSQATVPCLLCGDQGCALPFIPGRVQWCQASLCFLLLLRSFICNLEYICSFGQVSLQNCENNTGMNPYCLHVLVICFTVQCPFLLHLATFSCQTCVLRCGALETTSSHARNSVVRN